MSSSLKNTRGFKSIPRKIKVYFVVCGSKPATLHDLCSASNSIYMRLKILVHVLPLNVHKQLPLKSMAAASVQPRAEFSLMYRSLSERLSALLKTRRVLKPAKKVFLSRKTETSPKSAELTFQSFQWCFCERENSKGRCYAHAVCTHKISYAVLYLTHEYICKHGCIFLSGRGCTVDAVKVSTLELLTLTSFLRPFTLSSTISCRRY